jgi:hypothetical protein
VRFETVSQPVSVPKAIRRALYFECRRSWRPDLGAALFMVFVKGAGFLIYLRPPVVEFKNEFKTCILDRNSSELLRCRARLPSRAGGGSGRRLNRGLFSGFVGVSCCSR